jgi:cytochrome c biogenesis protein CcdA
MSFAKNVLLFTLILFSLSLSQDKLELHFFGSSTCGECFELKSEILSPLVEKHGDSLQIIYHDIDKKGEMSTLLSYETEFSITEGAAQELYFPDTVLLGFEAINADSPEMIARYLNDRSLWTNKSVKVISSENQVEALQEKVKSYSFWTIVSLGIIDGINPCAIATMIFLISFLAAQKRTRPQILIIGLTYTLTVFVTYTLIGVVAFEFLTLAKQNGVISQIVKWTAVSLAGGVGIFSFIDAYNFRATKNTNSIKLQLPTSLKKQIHKVINGNMKQSNLIVGTVVTGFLVTILETFCTGQTYLPAIQAMVKTSGLRIEGWLRLIFYNFLFVLPLLLVMVAAYFGLTWNKLAKETQNHMVLLKVILGVVMVALALYLALA